MTLPGALSEFDCKDVYSVLARVNDRGFYPPDEELEVLYRVWVILLAENYVTSEKEVTVTNREGVHSIRQWSRTQAGHRLLDRIKANCFNDGET